MDRATNIKVTVLGLGSIGMRHAGNFLALGCRVTGVDPDEGRRAELHKLGGEACEREQGLVEADLVVVATPTGSHLADIRDALSADCHLMVEKPMARTLDQAVQIFNTVRNAGRKCFVPFARAGNVAMRRAVDVIRSGEIGEPVTFVHSNLSPPYGWVMLDHWMHDQELSGGPVFDFSIHFIEMARACMGAEAESVIYGGANTTGRVKSDDQATLLVYYEGGGFGDDATSCEESAPAEIGGGEWSKVSAWLSHGGLVSLLKSGIPGGTRVGLLGVSR